MEMRFKIVEMKHDGGIWRVRFNSVSNSAGLGAPAVSVEPEEFQGSQKGMHEFTAQEVIAKAHRELANACYLLFKTAVHSIPNIDWETCKSLTISEILNEIGVDRQP